MRTSRCGMFLTIDRVILHSLQIGYSLNITFFKLSLKSRAKKKKKVKTVKKSFHSFHRPGEYIYNI